MITSNIGKIFLDAYNEKYGTSYDARTFFLEQFYPLFFDQNKYMMTAGNSPLENPKLSWDDMIKGKKPFETPEQRKIRFEKLIKKIEESEADASIARGYASLDVTATTSGQVTDLKLPNSQMLHPSNNLLEHSTSYHLYQYKHCHTTHQHYRSYHITLVRSGIFVQHLQDSFFFHYRNLLL